MGVWPAACISTQRVPASCRGQEEGHARLPWISAAKWITSHGAKGEGAYGQSDFIPSPRQDRLSNKSHSIAPRSWYIPAVGWDRPQPSASSAIVAHDLPLNPIYRCYWNACLPSGRIRPGLFHITSPFICPSSPCWFATVARLKFEVTPACGCIYRSYRRRQGHSRTLVYKLRKSRVEIKSDLFEFL